MFSSILIFVHVFVCIIIIGLVLLQQGKGASLSASFGGGGDSFFGATGADTVLTKITTGAAILFMVTSLLLNFYYRNYGDADTRIMQSLPEVKETPKEKAETTNADNKDAEQTEAGAKPSDNSPAVGAQPAVTSDENKERSVEQDSEKSGVSQSPDAQPEADSPGSVATGATDANVAVQERSDNSAVTVNSSEQNLDNSPLEKPTEAAQQAVTQITQPIVNGHSTTTSEKKIEEGEMQNSTNVSDPTNPINKKEESSTQTSLNELSASTSEVASSDKTDTVVTAARSTDSANSGLVDSGVVNPGSTADQQVKADKTANDDGISKSYARSQLSSKVQKNKAVNRKKKSKSSNRD